MTKSITKTSRTAPREPTPNLDQLLDQVAKEYLGFETLEQRFSDGLDFREVAVWSVKAALKAAYEAGRKADTSFGTNNPAA